MNIIRNINCVIFVLGIIMASQSVGAFDHTYKSYQKVLDNHIVFKGPQSLVNYKKLKSNPKNLLVALKQISSVEVKTFEAWDKNHKLAFLINSYNAFTLKLIIDHFPIKTIKDTGSLFSSPWKKKFFTLLGEKTHLDHIEHDLIRKNFKEPRIHFAVNCASMGCPSLAKKAFTPNELEQQLQETAKSFILNRLKNRFYLKEKTLYLSKIFKWYGDDFKEMSGVTFKEFIKTFIPQYLPKEHDIEWLDYSWDLNNAP